MQTNNIFRICFAENGESLRCYKCQYSASDNRQTYAFGGKCKGEDMSPEEETCPAGAQCLVRSSFIFRTPWGGGGFLCVWIKWKLRRQVDLLLEILAGLGQVPGSFVHWYSGALVDNMSLLVQSVLVQVPSNQHPPQTNLPAQLLKKKLFISGHFQRIEFHFPQVSYSTGQVGGVATESWTRGCVMTCHDYQSLSGNSVGKGRCCNTDLCNDFGPSNFTGWTPPAGSGSQNFM